MSKLIEKYFYIEEGAERDAGDLIFLIGLPAYVVGLLAFVITKTM